MTARKQYTTRPDGDDGWAQSLLYVGDTHFLDLIRKPKHRSYSRRHNHGPVLEVHIEEKGRENLRSANKSILTSVKSHEEQLVVSPPKMSSGNSLQENILTFEALSDKIQFFKLCEDAWLEHRVSAGMMHKTRPDEDDVYGQLAP